MVESNDRGTRYRVVVNEEEQYSIWPVTKEIPQGWRSVEVEGFKDDCLAYIEKTWTDLRPRSLQQRMKG
jgi:MbtH protein